MSSKHDKKDAEHNRHMAKQFRLKRRKSDKKFIELSNSIRGTCLVCKLIPCICDDKSEWGKSHGL